MNKFLLKTFTFKIIWSVVLIGIPIISFAQKRSYTTNKIQGEAPRIDGYINDDAWETAEWSGDFVQIEPYENTSPSQQTSFKVLYDDNNLYFAIRAFDSSPDSIVKRMSRRDSFDGDWVEVNIDSYHDLLTGFSFTVNASGVKGDEKITNDNNFDTSWDPIWYVKTSIDNKGWVAEMRIPLTQLRFGKQDEYVWGLQVNRRLFRKGERSSWQFISPKSSGWVHHFGEIYGINNITPKKQKDITPYVVGKMENYEKDDENPFAGGREYAGSIGVDGKFGITNDLTLDFTINPDFGQVEADPSEVNLSTFETFLPEKRSFFIEGKNIISHSIVNSGPMRRDNLFYSRRIGRRPGYWPDIEDDEYLKMQQNTTILGAFKLTGKTKKGLSIGILESFTQPEEAEIAKRVPNGSTDNFEYRKIAVEPFTNYFATRIEQDFNNSNTRIGAMITATNRNLNTPELKENMNSAAYTGGINFNHNWKDKTYYLNLNIVASQIHGSKEVIETTQTNSPHFFQRPDASHLRVDSGLTNMNGAGGTFQIGKSGGGKWRFTNWITYRSPGLNLNDMGYIRRTDEMQQVFWIQYRENEPKSFYRSYSINFNQWLGTTFSPEYKYFGMNVNAHLQFKNHWSTGLGIDRDAKSYSHNELRGGPALRYDPSSYFWGYLETDNRKKIQFELGLEQGFRDGLTRKTNNIFLAIDMQISDAFKLSLSPSISTKYNEIEYVSSEEFNNEERYIRGTINRVETKLTIRFTYNITPDFTIQYYAMPFISTGNYKSFKYITDSKANIFNDRFATYAENQIRYNENDEVFEINEEGLFTDSNIEDESLVDYSFDNPNFNVLDFNSSLVLRWEYLPGSTFYFVWTQHRNENKSDGIYSFQKDANDLFINTYPRDILLIKFSYRFGL